MPRFTKKPVTIEAMQLTSASAAACLHFIDKFGGKARTQLNASADIGGGEVVLAIKTLEGVMTASIGDWIIKGVNGEFYPCKPDIFEKTYAPAVDDNGLLTFGEAIEAAKAGSKIARQGWNGSGMYAVIMPGFPEGCPANKATATIHGVEEGSMIKVRPYWSLKTAQNDLAMWAPSGSDSLADDWVIV